LRSATSGAAPRLRRSSLFLSAVSALVLLAPVGAQAADNLGPGGVTASGSALTVGVSGASGTDGAIQARFSGADSPLFWGADTTNLNDHTAAYFALNTPSGLYSPQPYSYDNQPFTQLSAPVKTGTGTVGDPYVVTSQFRATANIDITQTVTHVSGTTRFTATWAVHNGGGATTALQAFEGADMYVAQNDNGYGTGSGTSPNRVIGSVASDGTAGRLLEQGGSPWTHYFSGMNSPFYNATSDSTYGSMPDTIDPTVQDSGLGVEWDFTLASNATRTHSVVWDFTAPAAPQAPSLTSVPAANATTNSTSASPAFAPAPGDTQVTGYECAVDAGAFAACASPQSLSGLSDGSHTFSVRAVNSAGVAGPATERTWTVDTTAPAAPTLTGAPAGTVATDHASIALSGEAGATFLCSVDGALSLASVAESYVPCASPLVLTGLADGNHTVKVKQVDAADNVGTQVASASWTVDTSVPAAPPASQPEDSTDTTAEVSFTTPAGHTAECSLDDAAYQACVSPVAVTGLSVGTHTLKLRMVNGAGTPGVARTVTWEVEPVPVLVPTPSDDPLSPTDQTPTGPATETPAATAPAAATPAPGAAPSQSTIAPAVCISRRVVTVHWKLPAKAKAQGFAVLVNGKAYKRLPGKARAVTVKLAGRPAGRVTVQIKTVGRGAALGTTRIYRTCVGKAASSAGQPTMVLKRRR
jgi:hypothetical protein